MLYVLRKGKQQIAAALIRQANAHNLALEAQ